MSDRSKRTVVRLAAEFVVIVVGVLVALGVDSWAQRRQDREREIAYLRDLHDELLTSIEAGTGVVEYEERLRTYLVSLAQALYEGRPAPPDSLTFWFSNALRSSSYRPSSAMADALIETGELSLIQNPDIRRRIVEYRQQVRQVADNVGVYDAASLDAVASMSRRVDRPAMRRNELDQSEWRRIASDPVIRGDLGMHAISVNSRLSGARMLVDLASALEEAVAAEVGSRGGLAGPGR